MMMLLMLMLLMMLLMHNDDDDDDDDNVIVYLRAFFEGLSLLVLSNKRHSAARACPSNPSIRASLTQSCTRSCAPA